jgi:hypothetical protein
MEKIAHDRSLWKKLGRMKKSWLLNWNQIIKDWMNSKTLINQLGFSPHMKIGRWTNTKAHIIFSVKKGEKLLSEKMNEYWGEESYVMNKYKLKEEKERRHWE